MDAELPQSRPAPNEIYYSVCPARLGAPVCLWQLQWRLWVPHFLGKFQNMGRIGGHAAELAKVGNLVSPSCKRM